MEPAQPAQSKQCSGHMLTMRQIRSSHSPCTHPGDLAPTKGTVHSQVSGTWLHQPAQAGFCGNPAGRRDARSKQRVNNSHFLSCFCKLTQMRCRSRHVPTSLAADKQLPPSMPLHGQLPRATVHVAGHREALGARQQHREQLPEFDLCQAGCSPSCATARRARRRVAAAVGTNRAS